MQNNQNSQNSQNLIRDLMGDSQTLINNSQSIGTDFYEGNNNQNEGIDIYRNCDDNNTHSEKFVPSLQSESSILCGSESNSQTHQEFIKNNFFGVNFCKKCNIPCAVDFMENSKVKFECECTYIVCFDILEFIMEYLNNNQGQSKDFRISCAYHKKETEFIKYCSDCGINLCKKCLDKNSELYSNTSKVNKAHENHTLIDLNDITDKFAELEHLMDNYEKMYENCKEKNYINIFKVIRCIIEHYKKSKNYNSYKSIKNAEKFLKKLYNGEYKFVNNTKKVKYINLIKQTSEKDFDKNILNHSDLIREISIKYIENNINFTLLENHNFKNLKTLIIRGMKFSNISPLFSCKFPVLEYLDLEKNNINNTIIDLFLIKKFYKLKFLSLYKNNITDEKIFDSIKNCKKLKTFFIGENPIEFDPNNDKIYEFPKSLEEFGMTGNLDSKKAIFINRLIISNLKIFYFSRNKIDNLKYLENIYFKRLEEFWTISNQIKNIKQLKYIKGKQNLKKISLKENQINNFNELIDIIEDFPNLKELILKNNNITQAAASEMEKKIYKIYNHELKIIV